MTHIHLYQCLSTDYKIINNSCDFSLMPFRRFTKKFWRKKKKKNISLCVFTWVKQVAGILRPGDNLFSASFRLPKGSQNNAHNITDNIILFRIIYFTLYFYGSRMYFFSSFPFFVFSFLLLLLLLTFVFCHFYGIPSESKSKDIAWTFS